MFFPVLLIEGADDNPMTGAGMNKFPVFQVDAYMGGPFLFPSVVEENEVAFAELSFLHFPAILLPLVVGVSFEFLSIYLAVDSRGQSRTIYSSLRGSTISIGYTYPLGRLDIKGMIVLHLDIDAQADGGFRQLLIVVSGSNGSATSQEEGEEEKYVV